MKIIEQSYEIIRIDPNILDQIEVAARNCYKSEDKICTGSAEKVVKMLINKKHTAMLEFGDIIVRFITNRGVTHEMVRHRVGMSYAQESTRYVKYDGDMEFIRPVWWKVENEMLPHSCEWCFLGICEDIELCYKKMINNDWRAEQAREVLPNSLKTEIIVKGNLRAWRHMLKLRTSPAAHPQFRALLEPLLAELKQRIPIVFDDI